MALTVCNIRQVSPTYFMMLSGSHLSLFVHSHDIMLRIWVTEKISHSGDNLNGAVQPEQNSNLKFAEPRYKQLAMVLTCARYPQFWSNSRNSLNCLPSPICTASLEALFVHRHTCGMPSGAVQLASEFIHPNEREKAHHDRLKSLAQRGTSGGQDRRRSTPCLAWPACSPRYHISRHCAKIAPQCMPAAARQKQ